MSNQRGHLDYQGRLRRIFTCVFVVALVLCLAAYGTLCQAQTVDTVEIRNSTGDAVFYLHFYSNGFLPIDPALEDMYGVWDREPVLRPLAQQQIDAIVRAFEYWTERLAPENYTGLGANIHIGEILAPDNAWGMGAVLQAFVSDFARPNGTMGIGQMDWIYGLNSQLQEQSGVSLETVAIHEVGHILGISTYENNWNRWIPGFEGFPRDPITGNVIFDPIWDPNTYRAVFQGPEAMKVYGDDGVWEGRYGVSREVLLRDWFVPFLNDPVNGLSHFDVRNALMTHLSYRNYAGFIEVEMAALNDIGYNINLRQFFGRSFYVDNQTITYTDGYFQHSGTNYLVGTHNSASYGLGLHVFANDIDINVTGNDILIIGEGGTGIRSDGSDNIIRIDNGIKVHADGTRGTGLLVAYGSGTSIIHRGDLQATGNGGIAVRFDFGNNVMGETWISDVDPDRITGWTVDVMLIGNQYSYFPNRVPTIPGFNPAYLQWLEDNFGAYYADAGAALGGPLVEQFDVTGTISGTDAAIWIADNAHVQTINFMNGADVTGNIISNYTYLNYNTLLTFGKRANTDGTALNTPDADVFTISVLGNITGRFNIETWGGTTRIDGNVAIPNRTFQVMYGSTLSMGTNTITASNVSIANGSTLVLDTGTPGTFATLDIVGNLTMAAGSTLQVGLGNTEIGTTGILDSDSVTVTGNATIGAITIDLMSLVEGTFALVTSTGLLTYTNGAATVLYLGASLAGGVYDDRGGTVDVTATTQNVANVLQLAIDIDGIFGNAHITWTGGIDDTWDGVSEKENWRYGTDDTWFIDGDAVTFDLAAGGNIVVDAGGVIVADMTVGGNGDWTFSGGDIFGDERANATTLTNVEGSLTKEGDGTLTLTNDNEFRGGATVAGGILQIGDGGTTGSIAGDIVNDGNVTFNRSDDITFDYDISGDGNLTKDGTGTLILLGSISLVNLGTTVAAGTLQIGDGGDEGNISGNILIEDGANVTFNRDGYVIFDDVISGKGSLTKTGDGTLSLGGVNTYEGKTTINDGILELWREGSIANSNGIDVASGATFDISEITTSTTIKELTGAGSVTLGLKELIIDNDLNLILNDLILSYALGGNNASGTMTVTGAVTNGAPPTTTIELSQWAVGTYTLMTATSGGIDATEFLIDPNSYGGRQDVTLTDTGNALILETVSYNYNLLWTGGALGGAGGNWDTTTDGNWVRDTVGREAEAFNPDDYVIFTNAGITQDITVGNGIGAQVAGMLVTGGDYTFTGGAINGAIPAAISITNQNATGKLEVTGGSATFRNAVNFTNGMEIASGAAVELGDGGSVGNTMSINNDGTLRFNRTNGNDYTLANNVSGTGTVIKTGTGTLTVIGTNTYTGGTTVQEGTFQIGNGGTTGSIIGDIDIANNAEVAFNRSNAYTFAGNISGSGSVTKTGTGELTLTGDNTFYTGIMAVNTGRLKGDVDSLPGNILNNAAVEFNQMASGTYGGVISGTGTLTKTGGATLTLTGASNTYTGLTTVADGTLYVNGSLGNSANPMASAGVVVRNGAIFGGLGTIYGNVTIEDGGTLSPGNSIGDLLVAGDFTFRSGAFYLYEIDRIGGDTLIVDRGTVAVEDRTTLIVDGTFEDDKRYLVIELKDFASWAIGTDLTNLFEIDILPAAGGYFEQGGHLPGEQTGYWITWILTQTDFAKNIHPFGTPNAVRAAEGMDNIAALGKDARINIDRLYNALRTKNNAGDHQGLADAFAQLHGEVFASSKEVAVQMQHRFQNLLPTGRDFHNAAYLPKLWNRWGTFTGDYNNRRNLGRRITERYSGYEAGSAGFAFGLDKSVSPFGLGGVAFGYDYADQSFRSIRSKAEIEAFRGMLYGSWYNGDLYCDAHAGYSKNYYDTHRSIDIRNINIDPFSESAKSKYDDDMGALGIEIGRVWSPGGYMLTPSVGVHYTVIGSPTVTEKGSEASLRVASGDYHSVRVPVGVKASRMFPLFDDGSVWIPELRASYSRELANDTVKVRTAFDAVRDVNFAATSGVRGQDHVRVGLGVGFLAARLVNIRFDYDCDLYNNTNADTFAATLGVSW